MVKHIRTTIQALTAAALLVAGSIAAGPSAVARPETPAQTEAASTVDVVTFRNGRVVEGEILEKTGQQLKMRVVVAGISTVTTYDMSDVLLIEEDVSRGDAAAAAPAKADRKKDDDKTERVTSDNPNAARIALINLEGEFGRDISQTPLERALQDAVSADPDVIILHMDTGQQRASFDGLFRAEAIAPVVEKVMASGHRVVFWIKRAEAGAAFLPLVCPEIYFEPDGRLGGIGTLQNFDIGDELVNEKQISLRLGHAEGLAITGGYAPELVRAMARSDYWLAVRFSGGQVQYMMQEPTAAQLNDGWIVLSDDGKGKNEDAMESRVRQEGNDVLNLDAEWAQRLQVAKGAYADLDDLVFALGLGSDYTELDTGATEEMESWSDRVEQAIENLRRLNDEVEGDVARAGSTEEQRRALGVRMRNLRDMRGIMAAYSEVLDPEGQQRSQIDVQIEQVRQQIQQLNNRRR